MADGGGPTNSTPSVLHSSAKFLFSERKPYPGWIAWNQTREWNYHILFNTYVPARAHLSSNLLFVAGINDHLLEHRYVLRPGLSCPDISSSRLREEGQCSRLHQPTYINVHVNYILYPPPKIDTCILILCMRKLVDIDMQAGVTFNRGINYHGDVHGIPVGLAVDRHSPDAQPPGSPHHTTSYLTSIGHKQLVKQLHIPSSRGITMLDQPGRKRTQHFNSSTDLSPNPMFRS